MSELRFRLLRFLRQAKCYDFDIGVAMNDPALCRHERVQLIAKDSDAEYVECLDCGAILEAGERDEKPASFNESLSDA